ncbi:MAG: glycosyltransferase [Aquisalimonadaceae bacterium]
MNSEPLITVITPTFNRADYLGQAIESVLAQTWPHFELLVVDDGSTDDTATLMERYLPDKRIQYFRQENQGQSVARNLALSHAKGEFVCFLDSDNAWLPEKLEISLRAFEDNPDVDIIYGDAITIDETGAEISRENMKRHSGRIVPQMLRDNCVSMNTAMTRRRCFDERGGMSGRRRVADDYDLWLRFSAYYRFLYIPEYLAYYRVMADQISSDKTRRFDTNEAILRDFLAEHGDRVTPAEARMGWCHFHTRKGRYLASEGRRGEALACYARALRHNPVARPPWRALAKLVLRGTG